MKDGFPNLSKVADTGWADDFSMGELDSIISNESSSAQQEMPKAAQTANAPTTVQQTTPQPVEDGQITTFLEQEVHGNQPTDQTPLSQRPTRDLSGSFKDSGTKTGNAPNTTRNNEAPNTNDPFQIAFGLIRELDLIRLPHDLEKLDKDTLMYYAQATKQQQHNEALNYVKSQVMHDPFMEQMFYYAQQGGRFSDIPRMAQEMQSEIDYTNLDLTNPRIQKELVKLYYSDGLDPHDDRDAPLISLIPERIAKLEESLKLEEESKKAQQFFIAEHQAKQRKLEQAAYEQSQLEQQQLQQQEAENAQWQQQFIQELTNSKWSDQIKNEVYNETMGVRLNNGEVVPQWQYKHDIIMNDPYLFKYFLNFVSQFDPNQMEFIRRQSTETLDNSTVSQLVERIQNKNTTNTKSQFDAPVNPNNENTQVVDVSRDWFF